MKVNPHYLHHCFHLSVQSQEEARCKEEAREATPREAVKSFHQDRWQVVASMDSSSSNGGGYITGKENKTPSTGINAM